MGSSTVGVFSAANTPAAAQAMQNAFNEVCKNKYSTQVQFTFCTEKEYREKLLNRLADAADEVKRLKDANSYRTVGGNIKKQTREVYSAASESMVPGYMVIVNDDGTYRVVYNVWRAGS